MPFPPLPPSPLPHHVKQNKTIKQQQQQQKQTTLLVKKKSSFIIVGLWVSLS